MSEQAGGLAGDEIWVYAPSHPVQPAGGGAFVAKGEAGMDVSIEITWKRS